MAALVITQIVLYLAVGLVGFALGWRLRAIQQGMVQGALQRDIEELQVRVSDAHARRARGA